MRPSTPGRLHIDPLLSSLGKGGRVASFRKNQIIFSQGDRGKSIFYLQKGSVKLTVTSKRGKEAILAILNAGSFFGENAIAANRPAYPVNAIALTEVRSLKIDPEPMLDLIHTDPDICDDIISSLIAFQLQMIEKCADNLLYPGNVRLAHALSSLAQLHEDPELRPVLKLRQQDLANMIGVTRRRVNVLFKWFRRRGQVV